MIGMIAGYWLGRTLSDLPSRLVPSEQPVLTVSELEKFAPAEADFARSYPLAQGLLFFLGGAGLFRGYLALFPGPLDVGLMFAVFGAHICLLGIVRGIYEARLGVGPTSHDLINQANPNRFLADSAEVQRRGELRVVLSGASMVFFFLVGGYGQAILAPALMLAAAGFSLYTGCSQMLDAHRTAVRVRSSPEPSALAKSFWMVGSGLVFVFGVLCFGIAGYFLVRFFEVIL